MNKKVFAAILIIAALIGAAAAALYNEYTIHQQATIGEVSLTITINGVLWEEGQTIDWGTPEPGDIIPYTLVIENTGTCTVALSMTHTNLPTDWDLSWTLDTETIAISDSATGTLTLTVSATATSGTYKWDTTIHGDEI